MSKSTVTLSIPGSTLWMSTNDLAASDTGEICRQYPMAVNTENTTMTGMLMTAADGLGMNCVALPWAGPELFADAALELEYLDSLLLVLSGAARGLFGVNMGAIRADWQRTGNRLRHLLRLRLRRVKLPQLLDLPVRCLVSVVLLFARPPVGLTEKLTCGRLSTCELCSRCLLHLPLRRTVVCVHICYTPHVCTLRDRC